MKRLLPFTLFCCFSISCMYAVQEQNASVTTNDQIIKKVSIKEATIEKSSSTKYKVAATKKAQSKTLRRLNGVIGHTIKKFSHREMIDRRKRIAGNN